MLTVWCVCVGTKYTDADVLILRDMVRRHMSPTAQWQFRCLSDRPIVGVDTLRVDPWPGWWSKLLLFRYAEGACLYLDLDVVVVADLMPLAYGPAAGTLSMPKNWARSGHGGWQSSVMAWWKDYSHIPDGFDLDQLGAPEARNWGYYGPKRLWGDQEYLTEVLGDAVVPMHGVYSYKYHCREQGEPPEDARVIAFHGEPKPGDVDEPWVIESRSTRIPA